MPKHGRMEVRTHVAHQTLVKVPTHLPQLHTRTAAADVHRLLLMFSIYPTGPACSYSPAPPCIQVSTFIIYPGLAQASLSIFACFRIDDGGGAFPENQRVRKAVCQLPLVAVASRHALAAGGPRCTCTNQIHAGYLSHLSECALAQSAI